MELVDSSTYEILLLFSTTNSFYRAEYSGMLNSVWEASQRGVIVKMLIQGNKEDNKLKESITSNIPKKPTCEPPIYCQTSRGQDFYSCYRSGHFLSNRN